MKHCSITESSDQPTTATLLANQHLLKKYFDSTGECSQFEHAAVKLYCPDEQTQNSISFAFGDKDRNNLLTENKRQYTSHPILYQRQRIGYLQLASDAQDASAPTQGQHLPDEQAIKQAETVAKHIALLIKRDQANTLSKVYLGKSLSLNGYSKLTFSLETFIEKASGAKTPVIIEGAFGCEKLAVASSIHYNSPLKHKPFIEINCGLGSTQEFEQKLINCFVQAKGGSIYLHGIDELPMEQQNTLLDLLSASSKKDNINLPQINTADVRLLFSTTESLEKQVDKRSFSKRLYALINYLQVKIPTLSERKEDIGEIIDQLVKQHRLYQDQSLSSEVKAALYNYDWPENYQELECTVARLLVLTNFQQVSIDELKAHAPKIFAQQNAQSAIGSAENVVKKPEFELISCLMNKEYDAFEHLHSGLRKALVYVAENYCHEITLTQLAQNAFVSPSHLSFLLKDNLDKSFKQILAELRIEKAKMIFAKTPNVRITDVSLDVGFGDLSHFEKIFKRHTKVTPRQYKNNQKLNA